MYLSRFASVKSKSDCVSTDRSGSLKRLIAASFYARVRLLLLTQTEKGVVKKETGSEAAGFGFQHQQ